MTHASLFSGIGGFDLAAEWMGWTNVFNCEINEFCRKVLKHHFPEAIQYEDIKRTDFSIYRGHIDILTGGFPCQPYSQAGKRLGKADERHLFPQMLRVIKEVQPTWVVGENVRGLVNWNDGLVFNEVQADLESAGYEVVPFIIPACGTNAPHRRERVWFVAYSDSKRKQRHAINSRSSREIRQRGASVEKNPFFGGYASYSENSGHRGRHGDERGVQEREFQQDESGRSSLGCEVEGCGGEWGPSNSASEGLERGGHRTQTGVLNRHSNGYQPNCWQTFPTQSPVCGGNDGIPAQLDGITFPKWRKESIHAYGNAVVPQVVFPIFKAIQEVQDAMGNQTTQVH